MYKRFVSFFVYIHIPIVKKEYAKNPVKSRQDNHTTFLIFIFFMSNTNFERILSQVKQKIEALNLKDKWDKFKLKLDQIPIPKWMLVVVTFISVVVAIASFSSKSVENKQFDSRKTEQYDSAGEYDAMVEEFALKVDRLEDLILDMSDSDNPFAYVNKIETLAAECETLHKKLKAAPLDSSQRLYVDQIYAELEDLIRRLTWN